MIPPNALTITDVNLLSSILLGLILGVFYLWDSETRVQFPYLLLVVGLGFAAALAVGYLLNGDRPRFMGSIGRAILWVVFCMALHVGNYVRWRYRRWAVMRRMRLSQQSHKR